MIGIGGWRGRTEAAGPYWFVQDGKLASDTSPGSAGAHGARVPFTVTVRDATHPITKGLPAAWMHQGDELYSKLRGPGHMTVLATAHSDPANAGSGRDEPMLMVLSFGKGRIFHTTLGHDVNGMSCVGFVTILQRGTEWAATGAVTQRVPAAFPTATTVSYRDRYCADGPEFREGSQRLGPGSHGGLGRGERTGHASDFDVAFEVASLDRTALEDQRVFLPLVSDRELERHGPASHLAGDGRRGAVDGARAIDGRRVLLQTCSRQRRRCRPHRL